MTLADGTWQAVTQGGDVYAGPARTTGSRRRTLLLTTSSRTTLLANVSALAGAPMSTTGGKLVLQLDRRGRPVGLAGTLRLAGAGRRGRWQIRLR